MKFRNIELILFAVLGIFSCDDQDNNTGLVAVPPRDLSEVAAENDAEIQAFLSSHFYNYEEFLNPPADFDFKIVIDSLTGENLNKIPLSQQVTAKNVKVSSFEFLLEGNDDVEHTYYYLEAREGMGIKPTVADSVFVNYEASILNGDLFNQVSTGIWWNNPIFQFPLQRGRPKDFRGVAEGVTNTAGGSAIIENQDGTFSVEGSGIGMIILPSGLANFNELLPIITNYTPVIYKYEVLTVIENTDHDNDGIPSFMEEDEDSKDGYYPNDDTDGDQIANFQDADDDNDGIPTRDEINLNPDGTFNSFRDTDGDGIDDHLDDN